MNKNCARCMKVVYPIEEFKCLDKVWHKTCFKCTECNMALNMKTYKGFNKNPYCEAHIPKAKATTIAETPELKRIAENTKIQSNVKYHAEFEKAKGKLTQIADDPETLRIKQNTKNISNVAYHGDIQKKAYMEKQRELTEIVDNRDNNESEYFSETLAAEVLPHYQPAPVSTIEKAQTPPQKSSPSSSVDATNYMNNNGQQYQAMQPPPSTNTNGNKYQQPPTQYPTNGNLPRNNPVVVQHASIPSGGGVTSNQQMQQQLQQKYYDQYENFTQRSNGNNYNGMSQSSYNSPQKTAAYAQQQQQQQQSQMTSSYNQQMNYNNLYNHQQNGIGKISDYDPMTDGPRNVPQAARPNQTLVYSSDRAALLQQQQAQQQQRRIGSVNDIDPVNGFYGSVQDPYAQQQRQYMEQQQRLAAQQMQQQQHQQQQLQQQQQQQQIQQKSVSKVRVYRALYDYEAQDSDEVSFAEGDLIFEVNSIDAGWMTGRIERTGQIGMLPANYIEQVMI